MIPIDNFVKETIRKIKKIDINNCIDLRPYKRDRSVLIEKTAEGYNIYEDGFYQEEYNNSSVLEVENILKIIRKKEFPRSNILRMTILKSKNR